MVKNPPSKEEMQETTVRSLGQKIPWRKNGNLPQYSCLGNPMDRGAWRVTVQGGIAKESDTT